MPDEDCVRNSEIPCRVFGFLSNVTLFKMTKSAVRLRNHSLTPRYIGTMITVMSKTIQRVQTGVRIEKRLLKVLKALAEQLDMSLGDLLEGMALHCFEGKTPFTDVTLGKIEKLKDVYGLELYAEDSHGYAEDSHKLDERVNDD